MKVVVYFLLLLIACQNSGKGLIINSEPVIEFNLDQMDYRYELINYSDSSMLVVYFKDSLPRIVESRIDTFYYFYPEPNTLVVLNRNKDSCLKYSIVKFNGTTVKTIMNYYSFNLLKTTIKSEIIVQKAIELSEITKSYSNLFINNYYYELDPTLFHYIYGMCDFLDTSTSLEYCRHKEFRNSYFLADDINTFGNINVTQRTDSVFDVNSTTRLRMTKSEYLTTYKYDKDSSSFHYFTNNSTFSMNIKTGYREISKNGRVTDYLKYVNRSGMTEKKKSYFPFSQNINKGKSFYNIDSNSLIIYTIDRLGQKNINFKLSKL